MQHANREVEVKFVVIHVDQLCARLADIGAVLLYSRIHEFNLLFDNQNLELKEKDSFLRLRKDQDIKITFKGPGDTSDGAVSRLELELNVNNFDVAQKLFEALGYHVDWVYEKYRSTYKINDVIIVIDETPFGVVVEIEGPSAKSIKEISNRLLLNWDKRLLETYPAIFERIKKTLKLNFRDMTFDNFRSILVEPQDYQSTAADQS